MKHLFVCIACAACLIAGAARAAGPASGDTATYLFRDTPIAELFEMISARDRVSIMVGKGVTGNVAVSLYDMTASEAIHAIAEAGGYKVVERGNGYLIVNPALAAQGSVPDDIQVRALKVQYSDPKLVADILGKHVGPGGKVTVLPQRRMIVAEDTEAGLARIEALLRQIDTAPRQVMIEAKILEVTLDDSENFGIDWTKVLKNGTKIGVGGLAQQGQPGLFFNYISCHCDFTAYLSALSTKNKVRTLATPKLLALENEEAGITIGDELGYRVTTTINNVTSESVQFLDTGVILHVTPSVDADGRIALKVRPEVSSGSVLNGVPSKKTTQVTTQLVAEDGQSILIAGLIKSSATQQRTGVPVLGDIPVLGNLFANSERHGSLTETVVVITPHLLPAGGTADDARAAERIRQNADDIADGLKAPAALK
ncbi:type II secretion system protein GspD [Massilia rhizosphaerae]|uniref:type II secretion system protein GspD n=1 Tax=Massilia rhizosphaerae TaxID=2784389 RepID=UPI0018DB7037|nr:type II secretion system protein GspD [Massilia rhizosphaerae]